MIARAVYAPGLSGENPAVAPVVPSKCGAPPSPTPSCPVRLAGDPVAVEWVALALSNASAAAVPGLHSLSEEDLPILWVAMAPPAHPESPTDAARVALPVLMVVPPGVPIPVAAAGGNWVGAVDFVRQPQGFEEVPSRVARLLDIHRRQVQTKARLDNLSDAVYSRTFDGILISLNAAAARLLGGTPATLAGTAIAERTADPEETRSKIEATNRSVLATGRARERLHFRTLEGRQVTLRTDSLLLRDAFGRPSGVEVFLSDVTREEAVHARLVTESLRNDTLASIASATRDSLEPSEVLPAAAAILGERIGARTVDVWDVDSEKTKATLVHQWCASGEVRPATGFVRLLDESPPFRAMVHSFEPAIWRDRLAQQTSEAASRVLEELGARAVVGFPLRLGADLVGILGITFAEPQEFPHDELVFFERAADQFALTARAARLYRSLRAQIDALTEEQKRREEAERDRQKLSAMLVHDLKNPLSAILASLELTLERVGASDERLARILRNSLASARGLHGLIEDALLVYRAKDAPRSAPVLTSPGDAAFSALDEAQMLAESRRITLLREIAPGMPPIRLDAPKYRRALANLLTNAIKFSPPGSEVRASIEIEEEDGNRWLAFRVTDNGPGLSDAARARLATPYLRFSGSEGIPGTGLGLAVVLRVALEHGGTLDAVPNGEGHHGSVFTLRIPVVTS